MATADDAATVLEQFCHDVANLPAEIAHLLEEIKAKDELIMQGRDNIVARDNTLQRHVKSAGSHVKHPKEDAFTKVIHENYDRMEILQKEKLALSQKAMIVLERQIKRFDVKLRDLQATDQFPRDASLPSLLQPSAANIAPPLSGMSTPLQSVSVNSAQGIAGNVANAAVARLAGTSRTASGTATPTGLLNQAHLAASAARPARESSADASKRRRLNNSSVSGNIPTQSSGLRQSSLGPTSTPQASTPGQTSRAGSAQPTKPVPARKAPGTKKGALPSTSSTSAAGRKRVRASMLPSKKGDRRRQLARDRGGRGSPSASPTPSDSHASTSPTPSQQQSQDGASDRKKQPSVKHKTEPMSDEEDVTAVENGEDDDTEVYCSCQRTSFGDMIGCDNLDCKYQWFHWTCVGLKESPEGEWLCPFCRVLPKNQIRKEPEE
ncbi:hypothetical protein K461DRAFT_313573 [Myriangium duriaei CBS 260.36]|uniref:Chromatin modification-related protein n=1 Tax=Myriangium duriaei CBS 260.36 TaxID=1168546 RepID=A0A9P4MG35_9PEZI|nr:hypothetical protein K461DRAFT_313573 [Myriangium duriaei CBS 260.36]